VQLRPGAFVALTVPDRIWPQTFRLPETASGLPTMSSWWWTASLSAAMSG
jgi:hypothetical protein